MSCSGHGGANERAAACSERARRALTTRLVEGIAIDERGDLTSAGVLLWPGLGATGAYYRLVADLLAGRTVAADPPGTGDSPALEEWTFERMLTAAFGVISACRCQAMVGHSIGADLAVGVASAPPPELRAVVLIDGGFLDSATRGALGMPASATREEVDQFVQKNSARFSDWETAFREVAAIVGTTVTPALEALVRDECKEVDGEIRDAVAPEVLSSHLLATWCEDVPARAERIAVPTLLVTCGQPAERAAIKRPAWERFADASPLVELHIADDWGHNPFVQDPERSTELIRSWLNAHL